MKTAAPALILVLAAALSAPGPALAQEPVTSFDRLDTRLKPGDTVWVTDAQGREVKGSIIEVSPSTLVLSAGGRRTFTAGDVRAVRERGGSGIRRGALWGAVAGAGAGFALALANPREYATYCGPDEPPSCFPQPGTKAPIDWWTVPMTAGLGAGLGTVVGALLPGKLREVYTAKAGASGNARLSIAPVITAHAKRVAVSVSF